MKLTSITALLTAITVSLAAPAQTIELPFDSVFKDYQAHKEVKLLDWKASNEAVRAAGGWRAYQREAQAPDVPNSSNSAPVPAKTSSAAQDKPTINMHQGHGK
jgi:hypothetical protein